MSIPFFILLSLLTIATLASGKIDFHLEESTLFENRMCGFHTKYNQAQRKLEPYDALQNTLGVISEANRLLAIRAWNRVQNHKPKTDRKNVGPRSNPNSEKFVIPVLFHKVFSRTNPGSVAQASKFNSSKIEKILSQMNQSFDSANIRFCLATHQMNVPKTEPLALKKLKSYQHPGIVDQSRHIQSVFEEIKSATPYVGFKATPLIKGHEHFTTKIIEPTIVDPDHILNIWLVGNYTIDHQPALSFGFPYGYAFFPSFNGKDKTKAVPGLHPDHWPALRRKQFLDITGNTKRDGIVIQANAFEWLSEQEVLAINQFRSQEENGFLGPLTPKLINYIRKRYTGETLLHEIGHYLSLFHTFGIGEGCQSNSHADYILDTPFQKKADFTDCVIGKQGVSSPPILCDQPSQIDQYPQLGLEAEAIIYKNAMSYSSDTCKKQQLFTEEQIKRIRQALKYASNRKKLGKWKNRNVFCQTPTTLPTKIKDSSDEELDQESTKQAISLFPNPLNQGNILYVEAKGILSPKAYTYRIFNMNGAMTKESRIELNPYAPVAISVTGLPPGRYTIQFLPIDDKSLKALSKPFIVTR